MATIHIILQKKGGVGKSMIASMWTQFLDERGYPVHGISIDTESVNKSFAAFNELDVVTLNVMGKNNNIDLRLFDALIETIHQLEPTEHVIIDPDSSCFASFLAYIRENDVFAVFQELGHNAYIHTPISSGGDLVETIDSLNKLVKDFPGIPFIVWRNRRNEDLSMDCATFENCAAFEQYLVLKKYSAVQIDFPLIKSATFEKDINYLMAKKMTFKAAIKSSLPLQIRQNLKTSWAVACEAMQPALDSVVKRF